MSEVTVFWSANTDMPCDDIKKTDINDNFTACMSRCVQNPQCTHFAWDSSGYGTCWQKYNTNINISQSKPAQNRWSGVIQRNQSFCASVQKPYYISMRYATYIDPSLPNFRQYFTTENDAPSVNHTNSALACCQSCGQNCYLYTYSIDIQLCTLYNKASGQDMNADQSLQNSKQFFIFNQSSNYVSGSRFTYKTPACM